MFQNGNGNGPGQNQAQSFNIPSFANSGKGQWAIVLTLLAVYAAFSSFYKIESGQEGVVTRFGAFHVITEEGPHFKLPFGIDQVYKVSVSRTREMQFGFRKDGERVNPQRARLESLMLTGDLNVAYVEWILQYRIADPMKYIFHAANVEKNIRDTSISVMRRVVGDKLVSDVITKDRVVIAQKAKSLTQEALDLFDMGIHITKLNMQNVTPPEEVKSAFNEINIARQEKETLINQAKGVYNKVIPEAEGRAARLISEAEAYSINLVNKAKGDSNKFAAVLKAYRMSPKVTRKRLYLETMEEIFSEAERFTIVDPKIKGIMPIFNSTERQSRTTPLSQSSQSREDGKRS